MIRPFRWQGLGRFGRVLGRTVALHLILAAFAGVLLFSLIDLVEVGNLADKTEGIDLLWLSVVSLPRILRQMVPVAAPIGAATALAVLVRRREVEAFLAAGAHPTTLLPSLLVVGAVASGLYAANQEWLVPPSLAEVGRLRRQMGLAAGPLEALSRRQSWLRGKDRLFRVGVLTDRAGRSAEGVLILRTERGQLVERWDVEQLVREGEHWIGRGIVRRTLGANSLTTEHLAEAPVPLLEQPKDLVASIASPDRLPLAELIETAERRGRLGRSTAGHRLELHRRGAFPASVVLAMVLAAAIALRLGRRQSLARALFFGALVGAGSWLLAELSALVNGAGALPPSVAAWGVPVILGSLALGAWSRVIRRGVGD